MGVRHEERVKTNITYDLGILWKTWVIKIYQSRDGHVVAQAARNLYQSAITIWQRTNYSTQLLLISCQHYTALWIEMKRAAGFWRSFYVMSDVLIGELDELDLTLVASTSNKATISRRNDATIFEMLKSEFKNLNSRWMARKSMASSSVTTIRWMKWRTRSITAWWPQIFLEIRVPSFELDL